MASRRRKLSKLGKWGVVLVLMGLVVSFLGADNIAVVGASGVWFGYWVCVVLVDKGVLPVQGRDYD